MKGFILCAGLGKRLRPITEEIPKPLLPFLGKPLVQYILEKLKEAGIEEAGINLHWKPEKIKKFFKNFEGEFNLHYFYEKELLDTGGALKNAEGFLKGSSFIVINSDIIFDFSLKEIIEYHQKNKNFATLLITDNPETNNLNISKDGKLIEISKKFSKNLKTFAGIGIYEPEILNLMEGKIFSIKDTWVKAIENNLQIDTFFIEKGKWWECGNIENYVKTLIFYLKKSGEKNFIGNGVKFDRLFLEGLNIIEEGTVLKGSIKLKNSIIFPEVEIKEGKNFKIVGKRFEIKIPQNYFMENLRVENKLLKNFTGKKYVFLNPLYGGGSTRNFFTFQKKYILLKSTKEDREFNRLIKINRLFSKHKIPVPEILKISLKNKELIMKNCGEYGLYDFSKFLPLSKIENLYERILEKISILHKIKLKNGEFYKNYEFSRDYFLWESGYFYENFLKNYLKIEKNYNFFKRDFEKLAEVSSSFEKRILHRDLQSQNILIKGKKITFIDFQSSRLGPPSYDISSLLWDPYLILPQEQRAKLLNFYKEKMGKHLPADFDKSLIYTKCQRHMQALGAYCFLSNIRGKKHFLKFIKPAVNYLIEEFNELKEFPSFSYLMKYLLEKFDFA